MSFGLLSVSLRLLAVYGAIPEPVEISANCAWTASGTLQVRWAASAHAPADYYELQISDKSKGQTHSIFSTESTEAELDFLLPNKLYWFRARAHAKGAPSLGPGTWGALGAEVRCQTGEPGVLKQSVAKQAPGTRVIESMRESEFTYDVDYLMNHNSGSITGDVSFLLGNGNSSNKSFLNVTFKNSTFTLYCIDVLKADIPGTITTGGDSCFADYLSCNDNGNATDPQCECDNWIDRKIGGINPDIACKNPKGDACDHRAFSKNCTCHCTASSLDYSANYTGMMPVFLGGRHRKPIEDGAWYSHPKDTECKEPEHVGASREDGSICTWKRRPHARVVRGWEVLALGWNSTDPRHPGDSPIDPSEIKKLVQHNADIFRKAFDSHPLKHWNCEDGSSHLSAPPAMLVV